MGKTYADTFIYTQYPGYESKIFEFIVKARRIDTKSKAFEDILYDIKKRRISDALTKVLTSDNVVLCSNEGGPLPKAFKVFVAKDIKNDKSKYKCFIDVTDIIKLAEPGTDGFHNCVKLEWLISYAINSMTTYIYTVLENKLTGNSSIIKDGCEAFVRCMSYIVDRIYKISTIQQLRKRVEYCAALYYQINLLQKDKTRQMDTISASAVVLTGIDKRDALVVDSMIEPNDFNNIETFVAALSRMFNFKDFKVSTLISMWMQAFGTGTIFALEYFPAFSAMLTDTYVGGYINQQMTIEKITGPSMVKFTKTILQIGASVS